MFYMPVNQLDGFERGLFVGLLVGEGHFGGDGRSPRSRCGCTPGTRRSCSGCEARSPDCRLYGPYHHGGRSYYQWMARG